MSRVLFAPRQLAFGRETSRQVTGCCSRRAGKSIGCAGKLLAAALEKAGCVALYITLSRINAKRIMWDALKRLNDEHRLGGIPLEAELCIALPNGSRVYLSGAADETEIEKFRGLPLGIVIIDEAQSFPGYLKKLVDEVLAPALLDYAGQLMLIGTPGPVPVGYFHNACHSPAWAHHQWTLFDNPYIEKKSGQTAQALLEQELARRGVVVDDPIIQREFFGRWVLDSNSLVFRYSPEKNHRPKARADTCTEFVIGIDLGFDDADAIAVLGWNAASPELDLVEEWVGAKQSISTLMTRVRVAYEKYQPLVVVADTGGLGKKIADEITARTGVPIQAADKQRKLEHIELLNDDMTGGRFFAPKDSRFAQDCMLVEWDRTNPEKPKISERYHSDSCDAVLYAHRAAHHWLHEPKPKPAPALNTPEWFEAQHKEALQAIEREADAEVQRNKDERNEERETDEWL